MQSRGDGKSLWHDVSLAAGNGSDGLFHCVNEISMHGSDKFELLSREPHNPIVRRASESQQLAAFGRAVPFNYGFFPQTFCDPDDVDGLVGCGGDDDPLDVILLNDSPLPIGIVARCRPIGAVCLIDEGEADWKVLAVSLVHGGGLSAAQSVEEVEACSPGRIGASLAWLDDFKRCASSQGATTALHHKVHGRGKALSLIERGHRAWLQLLAGVREDGRARGHWICPPGSAAAVRRRASADRGRRACA